MRLEEKLEMFDHTQVAMKKLSAQVKTKMSKKIGNQSKIKNQLKPISFRWKT